MGLSFELILFQELFESLVLIHLQVMALKSFSEETGIPVALRESRTSLEDSTAASHRDSTRKMMRPSAQSKQKSSGISKNRALNYAGNFILHFKTTTSILFFPYFGFKKLLIEQIIFIMFDLTLKKLFFDL